MKKNLGILAQDPETGRVVDVKPFFDLIGDYGLGSPEEVAEFIEEIMDFIGMHTDDSEPLEKNLVKNIFYRLRCIKQMFRGTTELQKKKN